LIDVRVMHLRGPSVSPAVWRRNRRRSLGACQSQPRR
jgi:hypothetical protein